MMLMVLAPGGVDDRNFWLMVRSPRVLGLGWLGPRVEIAVQQRVSYAQIMLDMLYSNMNCDKNDKHDYDSSNNM